MLPKLILDGFRKQAAVVFLLCRQWSPVILCTWGDSPGVFNFSAAYTFLATRIHAILA